MEVPPPAPDDPPDWNLLPHRPAEFFSLAEGFDRKDLKRAYNRLLKQFKPEKHPQEFQRIREAYEALDNRLRYGEQFRARGFPLEQYRWDVSPPAASQPAQREPESSDRPRQPDTSPSSPLPQQPAFLDRLGNETPEKLAAELEALSDKQPWHYYALAVLADLLPDRDPLGFFHWLLQGTQAFPRDPALYRLLGILLRSPQRDEDLPKLISSVAAAFPDQRFYSLTEGLWDQALRVMEFKEVRRLLHKCQSQLRDFGVSGRITFLIHFLKGAMWQAETRWIDEQFQFLTDNHQEIPGGQDQDLEFLFYLREYLRVRESYTQGTPLRRLLDETLHKHCTASPSEAQRAWLACQVELATSEEDLRDSFPLEEPVPAVRPFLVIWHFLRAEYGESPSREDDQQEARRVLELLQELAAAVRNSSAGGRWSRFSTMQGFCNILTYVGVFLILFAFTVLPLVMLGLAESSAGSGLMGMLVFLLLIVSIIVGYLANKLVFAKMWERSLHQHSAECYAQVWRPELLAFLARTHMPSHRMVGLMEAIGRSASDVEYVDWITTHARRDPALLVYSTALDSLA